MRDKRPFKDGAIEHCGKDRKYYEMNKNKKALEGGIDSKLQIGNRWENPYICK